MSARPRRCLILSGLVVGLALGSSGAVTAADLPPVYVTSVNNKILEVDFDLVKTKVIVNDPGSSFQGLAVRSSDRHIVVADHNQGGKVKIFSTSGDTLGQGRTITPLISFPSGVTLDLDQNLFVTNQHPGRADEVWRVRRDFATCPDGADPILCPTNGGYFAATKLAAPLKVNGVATRTLADVKHADGKLWVLVQDPAMLLRFDGPFFPGGPGDPPPCANPCAHQQVVEHIDGTPTGLTFTTSHVLVSIAENRIIRFRLTDFGFDGDFVANVGGRPERITVGPQGGQARAFVTIKKAVKRYDIIGGVGQNPRSVGKLNSPVGVNLASAGAAITRANVGEDPIEVALNCVDATFETVLTAGFSDCFCFTFLDPREKEGACGEGVSDELTLPADCELSVNDPDLPPGLVSLNFPNKIPTYVRGFRRTPSAIQGTLHLCVATTTAAFEDLITVVGERESQWLGFDPLCAGTRGPGGLPISTDPTMRPRFFISEEPPFTPSHRQLRERNFFINNTSHCGSDGADAWNMDSLWLTGARDTREADGDSPVAAAAPPGPGPCVDDAGIVDCQLNRLRDVLTTCPTAEAAFADAFVDDVDPEMGIIPHFDDGNYCEAKGDTAGGLVAFEMAVGSPASDSIFTSCPARLRAELRGRAKAAIFGIETDLCP